MGAIMFNKIEAYKEYRDKLRLLEEEERYKKNKSIVSAYELYKMNERRRVLMHNILKPISMKLQNDMHITKLYLSEGNGEGIFINIEFNNGNTDGFIILDNLDDDDKVDILLDTSNGSYNNLINKEQKLLASVYHEALDNDFDKTLRISSTSKIFNLGIDSYKYLLTGNNNSDNHFIKVWYEYLKDNASLIGESSYRDIDMHLQNNKELEKFLKNIKFYEENVPKYLIKKR